MNLLSKYRVSMTLLRTDYITLFKYSKQGILLTIGFTTINLTELFISEPNDVYEILDNLLEQELDSYSMKLVEDVKKDFRKGWTK